MRRVIVGAGAFGRELVQWMWHAGIKDKTIFVDDRLELTIERYQPEPDDAVYIAITHPSARIAVSALLAEKGVRNRPKFVHPSAVVASTAHIDYGCIICPFSIISTDAYLQPHVILNCYTSIGHDAEIGYCSTLYSHVDVTGNCKIGKGVMMGSGSRAIPGRVIGNFATIGAGAIIVANVPDRVTMYAEPARRLR